MATEKNQEFSAAIKKKIKDTRTEFIIINAAVIALGIVMVVIPDKINDLICQTIGVLLCVWGIIRIIAYFRSRAEDIFGSFGMAQGCAMAGFGIYLLLNPGFLAGLLNAILAIILLVTAVIKLQYAFDYMKLQSSHWWIQLIGVAVMGICGVLALANPFGTANLITMFIGFAFIFSGVWDIISVVRMSNIIRGGVKKAKAKSKYVDTDVVDD